MKVVGRSGQVMDLAEGLARSLLRAGHVKVAEPEQVEPEPQVEVSVVDYAAAGRTTEPLPDNATIRAWAAQQDIDCPDRGRVPNAVLDAYREAHS
jgi:hypothetical protein